MDWLSLRDECELRPEPIGQGSAMRVMTSCLGLVRRPGARGFDLGRGRLVVELGVGAVCAWLRAVDCVDGSWPRYPAAGGGLRERRPLRLLWRTLEC